MAVPARAPEARAPAEFAGGKLASLPSCGRIPMADHRTVTASARELLAPAEPVANVR